MKTPKNRVTKAAKILALHKDKVRLEWLMAFISSKGSDGIANMQWTMVDPSELMEDRMDFTFDRSAIDAERKRTPKP